MHESGAYEDNPWGELTNSPTALLKGINTFNLKQIPGMVLKQSGQWLHYTVLGFVATIITTAYTAATTTRLVRDAQTDVSSLTEAIGKGYLFCAHEIIAPALIARYPAVANRLVFSNDQLNSVDLMDRGVCNAAIVQGPTWFTARVDSTHHCETKGALSSDGTELGTLFHIRSAPLERHRLT